MKFQFTKGLFLTYCFFISICLQAQNDLVLKKDQHQWNLSKEVDILPDSSGKLTWEDVSRKYISQFKPITQVLNPQHIAVDYIWLRFRPINQTQANTFILTTDIWDEVTVYFQDSLGTLHTKKSGNTYPLSKREVNLGRYLNLPINLRMNRPTEIFIKLSQITQEAKNLNNTFDFYKRLELRSYEQAYQTYYGRSVFYGIYVGVLLIIILYKLVISLYIGDIAYVYFVLFLSCLLAYAGLESGWLTYFLFYERPDASFEYLGLLQGLSLIFLNLFARSYLRLSELFPKANRFILILVGLQCLVFVLHLLWEIADYGIFSLTIIISIISIFYVCIRCIRAGFKPAGYFLLAVSMFFLSMIIEVFTSTGAIPYDFYIEPSNFGNLIQVSLFSLGLAYRFQVMQAEVKTHKEEKQQMMEQQKEALEEEVKRQTAYINAQKEEIEAQNKELQKKQEEIQVQNEELYQQREEIAAQRDNVEAKNKQLELVNDKLKANEIILKRSYLKLSESQQNISLKNKELESRERQIRSSINASLSIQNAILPPPELLDEILKDYFIIYKPKDVVSGDFYWVRRVRNYRIFVTADCTGHGVPGALMSIIGNNALDKVISLREGTHPGEILEEVDKEVQSVLKQQETRNNYGMDMSVLVLEEYKNRYTLARFAGAKRPLLLKYPQEKELVEIEGSRRSIGGMQNFKISFETREIMLSPGTVVYMGTDGFADQNNIKRKKIGEKALNKALADISTKPLKEQKIVLEEMLKTHMQGTNQRDDILLMGFKI